jgi:hypothetical protein
MGSPQASQEPSSSGSDAEPSVRAFEDRKTNRRPIPADVIELRDTQRRFNEANAAVAEPRVVAHIEVSREALDRLEALHRYLADETDLDLTAHSRGSAVWLLSGRLLGLTESMWIQVKAGVANEVLIMGRAMHEAARVLGAVLDKDEEELLRLWLEDSGKNHYVRPKAARDAQARTEAKLVEALKALGSEPVSEGNLKEMNERMYDLLSRAAHNRRSACLESLWESGREMAYGWQPSVLHRAYYVGWAGQITVEVVHAVGDGFAAFFGKDFFLTEMQPLIDEIERVTREFPLGERELREAAGTLGGEFGD